MSTASPPSLTAYRSPSWASSRLLTGCGHAIGLGCAPGIFSRWLSTLLREVLLVPFGLPARLVRSETASSSSASSSASPAVFS
ncbi:Hypothetical predicted protein [Podarcis lilfordi]|uniref:Uncharacterized protein n=1 Tax=Podarcis lilfordi TaxID=74358 RepID=A0AA35JVH0_9SAUR|nr:Hypothetical predicted protein [Podarcis lilfordi]